MGRSFLVSAIMTLALGAPCAAVWAQTHEHHTAAPAAEKKVTVQGEVLDLACYTAMDGQGPAHAGCAVKCLKDGQPMGLLAKDGTVYLLFAGHGDATAYNKAKDLGGKNVEIQGEAASKGSLKGITIESVKAL